MSRTLNVLVAALAAGLVPSALTAQSADATASVTVTGGGVATVVNTAGLDFGTRPAGVIVHSSDVPTAATWNVTFNQDGDYAFTFTLPTHLESPFGTSVPITFGMNSASSPALAFEGSPASWNPAVPIGVNVPLAGIAIDILLGADILGDGTGDVSVNLTNASEGTYTGIITLTVAKL